MTTTSEEYADSFGFTEEEVFAGMDEFGYAEKEKVKLWYDGFVFGSKKDIYNPWSILNYPVSVNALIQGILMRKKEYQ